MIRTINIDGHEIEMKCTGNTPRVYRNEFTRDLFVDLDEMNKAYLKKGEHTDFSCIERLAYTMAKQANAEIGTIDEWLDQFDSPMALMMAMPDILGVWNESQKSIVEQKKESGR